jgi:16S rRNA processing protein RimM
MYTKEECFKLGSIARLHSFKGEVSIFLDVVEPQDFNELESVFVEFDNKLIPFFIDDIKIRNKGFAVVKFDGIDTEKKALMLLKCPLYLPLEMLPEREDDGYYDFEIKNFKVIDSNHGDIGTVNHVLDIKVNPLIEIQCGEIEILLPKMDQFIDEIDWDEKTMYVTAPDGLLEMYLVTDEEE